VSHEGRVALVTGAASGIGRSVAEQIAAAGGRVVAVDLDREALAWTENADGVIGRVVNVTREEDNAAAVEEAVQSFGGLDALVLNAGTAMPGSIDHLDLADYRRCMDVNLGGVVLGLRAALPALRASKAPAVAVTASISGLGGDPGLWAYNTAKGGVVNFVRAMAIELGREGIRVNGVCPGPTRSGMTRAIEEDTPAVYEALRRNIPLQRWGESHEVAAVLCFLVSTASSIVTGALVPADGGISAGTGQFPLPPLLKR